jgi:hypothetical protein
VAWQAGALALAAALVLAAPAHARDPKDLKTPQRPWQRLSPQEQRVLRPVAPDWDHMPGYQQERLLSSARRYPELQPIQKERFDQRIRDWATMTPEQRREARETFQGLRKLPPEKQHELRERWLRERGGEAHAPGPMEQRAAQPGEGRDPRGPQEPRYRQREGGYPR